MNKFQVLLVLILIFFPLPFLIMFFNLYASTTPPPPRIALVFGAGVEKEEPSPVLQSRLDAALELFSEKKIDTVVLSGNSSNPAGNEVDIMANYLQDKKIPFNKILVDYQGLNTQASCNNFQEISGTKNTYLITNYFHMPRAFYLCQNTNLSVTPYFANLNTLTNLRYTLRELVAAWKAILKP